MLTNLKVVHKFLHIFLIVHGFYGSWLKIIRRFQKKIKNMKNVHEFEQNIPELK
jgi:hypothetical protein